MQNRLNPVKPIVRVSIETIHKEFSEGSMKLDLSGIGNIFLSEIEQLNSKKFKLPYMTIRHFSILFIFPFFLLFDCAAIATSRPATSEEIKAAMDQFIGKKIDSVIVKWGPPESQYILPSDGIIMYRYHWYGDDQDCRIDWNADTYGIIISYRHEGDCVLKKK